MRPVSTGGFLKLVLFYMRENWRSINGFKGRYQISNYGRVKSLKRYVKNGRSYRIVPELILSPGVNEYGYLYVCLSKENRLYPRRVSRLVAIAFLNNWRKLPEVNHKDGNKSNNRVNNLEWCTAKENSIHAYKTTA